MYVIIKWIRSLIQKRCHFGISIVPRWCNYTQGGPKNQKNGIFWMIWPIVLWRFKKNTIETSSGGFGKKATTVVCQLDHWFPVQSKFHFSSWKNYVNGKKAERSTKWLNNDTVFSLGYRFDSIIDLISVVLDLFGKLPFLMYLKT